MPETAPQLRGFFYPTHIAARCPNFRQCRRCTLCRNYDPHRRECTLCESRKHPSLPEHHCGCTVQSEGALIQLEERMKRPAHDPNQGPQEVKLFDTAFQPQNQRLVEIVQQNPATEDGHK